MRYADFALFLIPAGVLVAWLCGLRGLSLRGVLAVIMAFGVLGGTLYWLGDARVFRGQYVPAHLQGTRIVPEHAQ